MSEEKEPPGLRELTPPTIEHTTPISTDDTRSTSTTPKSTDNTHSQSTEHSKYASAEHTSSQATEHNKTKPSEHISVPTSSVSSEKNDNADDDSVIKKVNELVIEEITTESVSEFSRVKDSKVGQDLDIDNKEGPVNEHIIDGFNAPSNGQNVPSNGQNDPSSNGHDDIVHDDFEGKHVFDYDELLHDNDELLHDNKELLHDNNELRHDNDEYDEFHHGNDQPLHDNEQPIAPPSPHQHVDSGVVSPPSSLPHQHGGRGEVLPQLSVANHKETSYLIHDLAENEPTSTASLGRDPRAELGSQLLEELDHLNLNPDQIKAIINQHENEFINQIQHDEHIKHMHKYYGNHNSYNDNASSKMVNLLHSDTFLVVMSLFAMIILGLVFRSLCIKLTSVKDRKKRMRKGLKGLATHMEQVTRAMSNDLVVPDSPKVVMRTYSNYNRGPLRGENSIDSNPEGEKDNTHFKAQAHQALEKRDTLRIAVLSGNQSSVTQDPGNRSRESRYGLKPQGANKFFQKAEIHELAEVGHRSQE